MLRKKAHISQTTGESSSWLRAAVLGANDGIISVAAVAVGVAGATDDGKNILTATTAALFAGALSMALGEYVSVSTQRDTEEALLAKEEKHLLQTPHEGELELTRIYQEKGLSLSTAELVSRELSKANPLVGYAEAKLRIDPNNLTNPWYAAYASFCAFCLGGVIPLFAVLAAEEKSTTITVFFSVLLALVLTGGISAHIGKSSKVKAITRIVCGGAIAMIITFGVGTLFGV